MTMRAVGFTEFGGPEVLRVISLPVPPPGPGQVRVRVAAAAVNPTDLAFRSGAHRSMPSGVEPPYVPGMDLAGVVDDAGRSAWRPGDRVMAAVSPWGPGGGAQADRLARLADQAAKGVLSLRVADVQAAERAADVHCPSPMSCSARCPRRSSSSLPAIRRARRPP
jgi:NADPH:quinone reductase-like Zn-dependent oxidoreductase